MKLNPPRCPLRIIKTRYGSEIEIQGGFDLVCIMDDCAIFPCQVVQHHLETIAKSK